MSAAPAISPLIVSPSVAAELLEHARGAGPHEACGLLAGRASEGRVTAFHPARNEHASPLRYSVHPDDLVRIVLGIEASGEDLVGVFHSHVRTAATPSPSDIREAHYPEAVHVIASLASTASPVALRAWRIRDGVATEVPLVLG
jgi:proteasome lid subunit RPN8/RPN11